MTLIQRLNDKPIGESVTLLAYGGAGTGKTFFAATCGDRTLHVDPEDRRATIQSKLVQEKYHYNPIYISFREEPLPADGAKALDEITLAINEAIDQYEDQFDIVYVDGASALRRFALNKALELNQKIGKSKTLGRMQTLDTQVEFVDVTIQDYTAEMGLIEKFILKMKDYCMDAKKHFILTAHERILYNPPASVGGQETVKAIKPGFTGKTFPDSTPGMFDLVWHFEVEGTGDTRKYLARTEGDSALIAKTCWPGLFPTKYYNPNFQDVVRAIKTNTRIK